MKAGKSASEAATLAVSMLEVWQTHHYVCCPPSEVTFAYIPSTSDSVVSHPIATSNQCMIMC